MSGYPPIADLVPHEPPILMLEELMDWEPGRAECRMTVRDSTPFASGGAVDSVVSIELMGQAVAACLGHEAFTGGEGVRVGMIIGCRRMELMVPSFPVGAELRVFARRLRGSDVVSTFECEIRVAGEVGSTALLTVYHASEPPQD